jgi:STE24 endopeptidase
VYDEERYKKAQDYQLENKRFGFITSSFSLLIMLVMLFAGGFALVHGWASSLSSSPIWTGLLFFGILMLAWDIVSTPFSVYDTFVIEEKYGFNKTTPKTFVLDKIKGWLLAAILGGGILALIIWFYQMTGKTFWLYAWGLVTVFSIFMTMFYSSLIVPLFNKQTPLEEGELKNAIKEFAGKVHFTLDDIFVIDGSKRSSKSNAYFSGLGHKKRIVLFDTLVKDLSTEEIVGVLAHEIGHYKKKHTLAMIFMSIAQTGLTLFIFSLLIDNPALSRALQVEEPAFHIGLLAFGLLYSPISLILGLGVNQISRKNEYTADRFAGENYKPGPLKMALKKLSVNNLSNLTPHPAHVFFHYSHPPLLKRLEALDKIEGE